jgi:hypothetical protein
MFLMRRLVSRSSRALAVMVGASTSARGRDRDDLRGRPGPSQACTLRFFKRPAVLNPPN